MAEEEIDNDDELSYMDDHQLDEEEYRDVRKPITVAYIKLKESWDSRTYILNKMEELKDKFYQELEDHKFISDLPVVVMFERFLENYDEYKLKWEQTVETYNQALRDVVDSVDTNYIHVKVAGKEEKEKIAQLQMDIQVLKQKQKREIVDYEKKISDGLFRRDEFIKKLEVELKRLADDKGNVLAQDVLDAFQNKVKKEVDLKKYQQLKVGIKNANPEITDLYRELKKAPDAGRKFSAMVSGLKRSVAAGNITEQEREYKMYVLTQAMEMFKKSDSFTIEQKDEESEEGDSVESNEE